MTNKTFGPAVIMSSIFGSIMLGFVGIIGYAMLRGEETPLLYEAISKKDPEIGWRLEIMNNQSPMPMKFDNFLLFGVYYKDEFIATAKKYDLPPELLLVVFQPELLAQNGFSNLGDKVATHIPLWNPSIGLGQVRIETAVELAKHFGKNMTRDEIIASLNTPEGAIEFVAMYLRKTIDDKKMGSAHEIVTKPERLVELYGYYVGGQTPVEDAKLVGLALLHPFTQAAFYEVLGTYSMEERICIATKAAEFADLNRPSSVQKLEETTKRFRTEDRGEYYCKTAQDRPRATEMRERTKEYQDFLKELRQRDQRRQRMRPTSLIRREHRRSHC